MASHFVDPFEDVKIPWNIELKKCVSLLENAGHLELESGPDFVFFENDFEGFQYEIYLSFPEKSFHTLRSVLVTMHHQEEGASKTKCAIRNFRKSHRLLRKQLGSAIEMNDFDPSDEPIALLRTLKDEDFPEVIWESNTSRVILEIEESRPFQTVIRYFCQLPASRPKESAPLDILSLIKDMDINLEAE